MTNNERRNSLVCRVTGRHWWVERYIDPMTKEPVRLTKRVQMALTDRQKWNLCLVCRWCKRGHMAKHNTYRCSDRADPDPCILERHHQMRGADDHVLASGLHLPIGGALRGVSTGTEER